MMSEITDRCAKVMATVMEVDLNAINDNTGPDNLAQWDSLSHVQLVLGLEKEFNLKISPEDGIEHFTNFKSITKYILQRAG